MVKANLETSNLVYSAKEYEEFTSEPDKYKKIFRDSNYSAVFTGMSGSGKDSCTGKVICNDLEHGRTVVIFDVKMEYTLAIFGQNDPVLRDHLLKDDLAGRGYKVTLWLPYVNGMYDNKHFQALLKLHHPNLTIRPFRMLKRNFISEDSANMSLQKSALQSMADSLGSDALKGSSREFNIIKEELGRAQVAIDNEPMKGEGWEYVDFEKMTTNGQINIISTYFMLGKNMVATVSFMIGILNELMTIGKKTHKPPSGDEVFSVVIPELQIIMPKGVKSLKDVVSTLTYSMLAGLLLLRSFGTRLRINLQNLSAFPDDMYAQCRIFLGRTNNINDLKKIRYFGFKQDQASKVTQLSTGTFIDTRSKEEFNVVPKFHKSREREYLVNVLKDFAENPAKFLFKTKHGLLSEIIDHKKLGLRFPCTVSTYNRKVKDWLKQQKPLVVDKLEEPFSKNSIASEDAFDKGLKMLAG